MKALICKLFHKYYTRGETKHRLEDNKVIIKETRTCLHCGRNKSKFKEDV